MENKVQKDMTPSYERRDDGIIIKYSVVGETINAKDLRSERSMLRERIKQINEILGETQNG